MASLGHSARPGTGGSGWDSHHQAILGAPCPGALCFLSWAGCLPRLWGPGAGLRERPRADLLDDACHGAGRLPVWSPPMTAFDNQASASLLRNATRPVRPRPCCWAGIMGPSGPGLSSRLPLWPWGWAGALLLHTRPSMGF